MNVYVKTNGKNHIIDVNSSAFLVDTTDWVKIDEGSGDRYTHAQGYYFDKPLSTDNGVYQYKLDNGRAVERTADEIAIDDAAQAVTPERLSTEERLSDLEAAIDMLLTGVTE